MILSEGEILGLREDSRVGVIQALWTYIKLQGLQDKADRRMIRADDKLRMVGKSNGVDICSPN